MTRPSSPPRELSCRTKPQINPPPGFAHLPNVKNVVAIAVDRRVFLQSGSGFQPLFETQSGRMPLLLWELREYEVRKAAGSHFHLRRRKFVDGPPVCITNTLHSLSCRASKAAAFRDRRSATIRPPFPSPLDIRPLRWSRLSRSVTR